MSQTLTTQRENCIQNVCKWSKSLRFNKKAVALFKTVPEKCIKDGGAVLWRRIRELPWRKHILKHETDCFLINAGVDFKIISRGTWNRKISLVKLGVCLGSTRQLPVRSVYLRFFFMEASAIFKTHEKIFSLFLFGLMSWK